MNEFWNTIIASNIGITIGGIVSIATSYILFLSKCKREDFVYFAKQREVTYKKVISLTLLIDKYGWQQTDELHDEILSTNEKILPELYLYASKDIQSNLREIIYRLKKHHIALKSKPLSTERSEAYAFLIDEDVPGKIINQIRLETKTTSQHSLISIFK